MRTLLFFFLFTTSISFAQVGIGTTNPNPDALLDLTTSDQGLLLPRVVLTDSTVAAPLSAHVPGMFVFNTTASGNVNRGVYYNDGISWKLLGPSSKGWLLTGNTGTISNTNFLGTLDNQALTFRTNNIEKVRIETNGTISTLNTGNSVFIGENAGANDDLTNNLSTFVGFNAGMSNTDGIRNTAIGNNALSANTTGRNNTAIGGTALNSNSTGDSNIAIGAFSLSNNTVGRNNVGLGNQTLRSNIFGEGNITIGDYAGRALDLGSTTDVDNDFNVFIGGGAGNSDRISSRNVYIGYDAGAGNYNLSDGSGTLEDKEGNVFIGNQAGYDENGSNKLYIENSDNDSDNALIYGEFDTNILRVNGTLQISNPTATGYALPPADGTANQVLTTDGSGVVTWQNGGAGSSTLSISNVNLSGNQTITSANTWTKVEFDNVDFDLNTDFDTGNNEFVVPADGIYRITAMYTSNSNLNNNDTFGIRIRAAGNNIQEVNYKHMNENSAVVRQVSSLTQLNAGDTIEIQARVNSASGLTIDNNSKFTSFSVERVR